MEVGLRFPELEALTRLESWAVRSTVSGGPACVYRVVCEEQWSRSGVSSGPVSAPLDTSRQLRWLSYLGVSRVRARCLTLVIWLNVSFGQIFI